MVRQVGFLFFFRGEIQSGSRIKDNPFEKFTFGRELKYMTHLGRGFLYLAQK